MKENWAFLLFMFTLSTIAIVASYSDSRNKEVTKQTCYANATSETQFLSCKEL